MRSADAAIRRRARLALIRAGDTSVLAVRDALRGILLATDGAQARLGAVLDRDSDFAFWVIADRTGYVSSRIRCEIGTALGRRAARDARAREWLAIHALLDGCPAVRAVAQSGLESAGPKFVVPVQHLQMQWTAGDLVPAGPAQGILRAIRAADASGRSRRYLDVFTSRFGCDMIEQAFVRSLLPGFKDAFDEVTVLAHWRRRRRRRSRALRMSSAVDFHAACLIAHLLWTHEPKRWGPVLLDAEIRDLAAARHTSGAESRVAQLLDKQVGLRR